MLCVPATGSVLSDGDAIGRGKGVALNSLGEAALALDDEAGAPGVPRCAAARGRRKYPADRPARAAGRRDDACARAARSGRVCVGRRHQPAFGI